MAYSIQYERIRKVLLANSGTRVSVFDSGIDTIEMWVVRGKVLLIHTNSAGYQLYTAESRCNAVDKDTAFINNLL